MHCPKCKSSQRKKNGFRRGKQSYRCKNCGCQYVENPKPKGYLPEVKQLCLKMYLNGMGFRAIARVTEIDHTTIMRWVEEAGESLPDEPQDEEIPEITEIAVRPCGLKIRQGTRTKRDELQTFVGSKKNQFWIWSGRECAQCLAPQGQMRKHRVNHQKKGIILWNIGDRSHESFQPIWQIIKCWHSFFYVTRTHARSVPRGARSGANAPRWKVYPMYIELRNAVNAGT